MLAGSRGAAGISITAQPRRNSLAERQKSTALAGTLARLPGKERGKAKVPDSPRGDGALLTDSSPAVVGKISRRSCSAYQEATAARGNLP